LSFFDPLLRFLLTPWGVGVLAALDSTLVFWLPLGIDLAVVILGAQHPRLFWIYPLAATAGSLAGATTTFLVGHAAGEAGLKHFVPERKLEKIQARVRKSGALTLGALDLLPPPFPFTFVLLAAGALDVNRAQFFSVLAAARLLRFGLEAALGAHYGAPLALRIESRLFRDIAGLCVVAAIGASVISLVRLGQRARARALTR
jgi:membrane protein YqaA with SNARE-associated domain